MHNEQYPWQVEETALFRCTVNFDASSQNSNSKFFCCYSEEKNNLLFIIVVATLTRWVEDLVNHTKDIHEVKDNQPLIQMTSAAGVWQLEPEVCISMDRKLGLKGGVRTHPQQHHPVNSPRNFTRGPANSTLVNTKRTAMTFHHTPTTTTQPTYCVGRASPQSTFHTLTASRLCPPFQECH